MSQILTPSQIVATLMATVNSGQDDESRISALLVALVNLSQSVQNVITPTASTTALTDSDTVSILQNGQIVQYSASDLTLRFQLLITWLAEMGFDPPDELFVDNMLLNS